MCERAAQRAIYNFRLKWLFGILFAGVPILISPGRLFADPPAEAGPVVTTPAAPGAAPAGSAPAQPAQPPAETVIKVQAKPTQKAVPQSNASQTVLPAPAITHADPDLTLPAIIARFVPGASLNPDNGLRIRGADDQFETYLDGVPVPQSVSGSISDVLDPKDIQSLRIYTGGFPAEFGNQLSAVFDITTRSGSESPGGMVSQSAASRNSYVSSVNYGGSDGKLRYFVSGSHRQTDFYLNPPTETPVNDGGHEDHGLLHISYNGSPKDRLTLLLGANGSDFHNPGTPDTQQESGTLANVVWNHVEGLANTKLALYTHGSTRRYNGSPADLDEGNLETNQNQKVTTTSVWADHAWQAGPAHRLKAGLDISKSTVDQDFSIVLPDASLTDANMPHARNIGLYIQDDWTAGRFLINYGARYDQNSQDITTDQVSPRLNVKYRLNESVTLHAYYDRLFQPIPTEDAAHLVGNSEIGDNGTLSPLQPERDNLYEIGIDRSAAGLSLGISA